MKKYAEWMRIGAWLLMMIGAISRLSKYRGFEDGLTYGILLHGAALVVHNWRQKGFGYRAFELLMTWGVLTCIQQGLSLWL